MRIGSAMHFGANRARVARLIISAIFLALPAFACSNETLLSPKVPTPTLTLVSSEAAPPPTEISAPVPSNPTNTLVAASGSEATTTPAVGSTATETVPPTSTVTLAPTLTETPSVTSTATVTPTAVVTASIYLVTDSLCMDELVRISGMTVVDRTIEFTGTAAINNFAYYKLEYQSVDETEWHFIDRGEVPVRNGSLYIWDTSILPPGQFRVSLIAVDNTGNYPPPCTMEIEILK